MNLVESSRRRLSSVQGVSLLVAFLVIALVMAVYWQTFSRIIDMWSLWDYQYGWLVYPVCLYLLASNRDALAQVPWRASGLGVVLLMVLVLMWLIARTAAVQVVEFLSATLMIFASFWALAGTAAMRKVAFPLLLFLAAVPMGGFLVEPLMRITAEIAAVLLAMTGVPVLRDNQFFSLPGGTFEVADVCSGFRYLISGIMLALAYVYMTYSRILPRLIFVAVAAIVLVVANGVRAFIVMAVASATEMRVFGGADHVVFGMILFVVFFVAMILVGERFADPPNDSIEASEYRKDRFTGKVSGPVVAVTLAALLAGPLLNAEMMNRELATIVDLPFSEPDGCTQRDDLTLTGTPAFQNVDYERLELFSCGAYESSVYVASYRTQEQGKELVAWGNRVWPNEWRRYVEQSTVSVSMDDGIANVKQVLVRHPAGWRLIWYWYQVGPSSTSSQVGVKLLEVMRTLTFRTAESSIVVATVASNESDNVTELRLVLEKNAREAMIWNRERVELGSSNE